MSRDERFTPAHHELKALMELAEAAFAAMLARLRAERQLTQAQLAEALSVPVEDLWPGFGTGWRSGVM